MYHLPTWLLQKCRSGAGLRVSNKFPRRFLVYRDLRIFGVRRCLPEHSIVSHVCLLGDI